jgi:hypothetical protein
MPRELHLRSTPRMIRRRMLSVHIKSALVYANIAAVHHAVGGFRHRDAASDSIASVTSTAAA